MIVYFAYGLTNSVENKNKNIQLKYFPCILKRKKCKITASNEISGIKIDHLKF